MTVNSTLMDMSVYNRAFEEVGFRYLPTAHRHRWVGSEGFDPPPGTAAARILAYPHNALLYGGDVTKTRTNIMVCTTWSLDSIFKSRYRDLEDAHASIAAVLRVLHLLGLPLAVERHRRRNLLALRSC